MGYEARQVEKEKKQKEREAKQAEREANQARRPRKGNEQKDFDVESNASTVASTILAVDEQEVERKAMLDKDVRKFTKVLREIAKLEGLSQLEPLQTAKLAKKANVERELAAAKWLALNRARNELRQQARA